MRAWPAAIAGALILALGACGGASAPAAPASGPASPPASRAASPQQSAPASGASAAGAASGAAASGAKQKVRAGYLSHSTTSAIEFISKNAGLYDKYGLDVELDFIKPAILTTALNAGKDVDVGYASAANIPTVNVKGGDLVMLAASAQGGIFDIIGTPGLTSIKDLKGKKAAVTSTGSTTDLLLRKVLQDNGLVPEKDVSIVVIGDDSALVAALATKQVDAIVNSEPFSELALSQGGVVLYDQSKSGERAVQTPVTVKRSYLPAHRDMLKRLLMANMEAIHMMKTNPDEAARYSAHDMGLDDVAVVSKAIQHAAEGMDKDMNVPLDYLAASLKIAAANVPEVAQLKPEDLVDLSLLDEIRASGFLDKLYGGK
ncbi:MAG TPA: ABC transporter substrate-binding protein [Chloroflexota bacterium]|nr:ABC transporter substrate-binding protein [Chloroflexota bacterium]